MRKETDLPQVTKEWGWEYHHLGIPTKEKKDGEVYLPQFKFYISGFSSNPFGIEWMRFEADCIMHPLIQTIPHLAFVVKDLDFELLSKGFKILHSPNEPMDGIRVAMIEIIGAPVELMEFCN
jgi:hypothetical protein